MQPLSHIKSVTWGKSLVFCGMGAPCRGCAQVTVHCHSVKLQRGVTSTTQGGSSTAGKGVSNRSLAQRRVCLRRSRGAVPRRIRRLTPVLCVSRLRSVRQLFDRAPCPERSRRGTSLRFGTPGKPLNNDSEPKRNERLMLNNLHSHTYALILDDGKFMHTCLEPQTPQEDYA